MELRRNEFAIAVIGINGVRFDALLENLRTAGYTIVQRLDFEQLLETAKSDPPHFVLVDYEKVANDFMQWTTALKKLSPEIRVVALVPVAQRLHGVHSKQMGLLADYILSPWIADNEVIESFDRLATLLSYQYENEQLREIVSKESEPELVETTVKVFDPMEMGKTSSAITFLDTSPAPSPVQIAEEFVQELEFCTSLENVLDRFLSNSSGAASLFLKPVGAPGQLVLQGYKGILRNQVQGFTVGLVEGDINQLLNEPQKCASLEHALRQQLNWNVFGARTLALAGKLEGLFVCSDPNQMPSDIVWHIFKNAYRTQRQIDNARLGPLNDLETGFWNAKYFPEALSAEISRARRTLLPLGLMIVELDTASAGALAKIAQIITKTSRITDIRIRLQSEQIAILLPSTPLHGVVTKAERLRRIVEVLGSNCTVSIGVSEFPRLSSDPESILRSADEALSTVRQLGRNKVCIGSELTEELKKVHYQEL